MAVAAAIGVEADEALPVQNGLAGPRLQNKMKMIPNHIGDINRSIEKMSIGSFNPPPSNTCAPSMGQTQTTMPVTANTRRGSNWTNSTEGYGSMRSEQSMMSSRRCSDVSAMSQVISRDFYSKKFGLIFVYFRAQMYLNGTPCQLILQEGRQWLQIMVAQCQKIRQITSTIIWIGYIVEQNKISFECNQKA